MGELPYQLRRRAGGYVDRRAVDQTGLDGAWDFTLEWTPAARLESSGGLSLFAALQEQLGLQLESKKVPIPVVVVDSMDRVPTDN